MGIQASETPRRSKGSYLILLIIVLLVFVLIILGRVEENGRNSEEAASHPSTGDSRTSSSNLRVYCKKLEKQFELMQMDVSCAPLGRSLYLDFTGLPDKIREAEARRMHTAFEADAARMEDLLKSRVGAVYFVFGRLITQRYAKLTVGRKKVDGDKDITDPAISPR